MEVVGEGCVGGGLGERCQRQEGGCVGGVGEDAYLELAGRGAVVAVEQ